MNSTKILIALLIIIIAGLIFWPKPKPVTTLMSSPLPSPSTPTAPLNQPASVTLKTTAGDITIELDTKNTPITANNFITLAQKGFYDNTIFHRVIKGFMIQAATRKGTAPAVRAINSTTNPSRASIFSGAVAMANKRPQHQRLPVFYHAR